MVVGDAQQVAELAQLVLEQGFGVVRTLLVPATMRLLGRVNWYAPAPRRRFYARYGIREDDAAPATAEPALSGVG
jgi:RND superfamily putative drug exporter